MSFEDLEQHYDLALPEATRLVSLDAESIKWQPNARQAQALARTEFEILYGGARGGGKTDAGLAWLLYDVDKPYLRGLVVRKNAADLNDWVSRAKIMYSETGAVFTKNPYQIVFPSGATIVLGHLNDENAYEKYQGHEYQRILIEELTQIPSEKMYSMLISSCRSSKKDLRPQVFATTNPGGRGHNWVKNRWRISGAPKLPVFSPDKSGGTEESLKHRIFIPARIDDNPALMAADPGYVNQLNSLPDGLREAWRNGSWDDVEIKGAYYARMLLQAREENRVGFYPHNPEHAVHTVWDIGFRDSTAIGFFQKYDGKVCLIDYYEASNEAMPHFVKILQTKEYVYGKHFAPHDISVHEQSNGRTRKENAELLGLFFEEPLPKLPIDDGINAGRLLFTRLFINDRPCEQWLEAIRQYRKEYDEKLQCYRDKPVHDWTSHGADMYRYAALAEPDFTSGEFSESYEQEDYTPLYKEIGI